MVFTSNSLMNWRAYKQATELVEKLTNCHRIESTMESVILSKDLFDVIQFSFQFCNDVDKENIIPCDSYISNFEVIC